MRVFTLISHRKGDICEGDEGVLGFIKFVIPCEHSTELFDISEITFYNITLLIQLLTVTPRLDTIALRRNYRSHSTLFRRCPTLISLMRLVHNQGFALANLLRNLRHQLLSFRVIRCRSR